MYVPIGVSPEVEHSLRSGGLTQAQRDIFTVVVTALSIAGFIYITLHAR